MASPAVKLKPEEYLADLDPAQRETVLQTEGPVLVVAGAGSGKTRALTRRVAHVIATQGAKPNEILAITFTNKAAGEMRARLEELLGNTARAIWILTFHAACGRILRREAPRLGYKSNFTIYDQADQIRLTKDCLEELERDPKRFVPRGIHAQISNAKNELVSPEEYLKRVQSFYDQTVADVYALYQRRMLGSNAMDFDDLLMLTVEVLERFPEARKRWQKAFRYVLVDEYQDTNHAQYRLLQLLGGEHGNVCAVGDPDQCVVEGTLITMADGSTKPIEQVRPRDEVLSCHGSGVFRPARVTDVHRWRRAHRYRDHNGSRGAEFVSYAGAHPLCWVQAGHDPTAPHDLSHVEAWVRLPARNLPHIHGRAKSAHSPGPAFRMNQEHADAAWVLSTHSRGTPRARKAEMLTSLRHRLPTLAVRRSLLREEATAAAWLRVRR